MEPYYIIAPIFYLIAIKAILGFHWPWETCQCCGRKFKNHPNWNEEREE